MTHTWEEKINTTAATAGDSGRDSYCQPTSSKVLIEDMVTNEDDDKHFQEYHILEEEDVEPPPKKHRFWDCPVVPKHMAWPGDGRMPIEWNMMISDVQGLGLSNNNGLGSASNDSNVVDDGDVGLPGLPPPSTPVQVDSTGPYKFTRARYLSKKHCDYLHRKIIVGSELGSDDVAERLAQMRNMNKHRNHHAKQTKQLPRMVRKGKEKAVYHDGDIPELWQHWHDEYKDLLQGVPESMPPFREVDHEIPLINQGKRYHYHLPHCPNSLKAEFNEKVEKYTRAGWWKLTAAKQAAPMLCLLKKDRHLRTVIDCWQRNENTVKDVTPMPDQDGIWEDVARGKYRSKIDLSDAYEQAHIVPDNIWKTMIQGTFTSAVMQQGDCNTPATFQRLMTSIFQDVIGVFMHVYIDDIFVFSDSIEEHEAHLRIIFEWLC